MSNQNQNNTSFGQAQDEMDIDTSFTSELTLESAELLWAAILDADMPPAIIREGADFIDQIFLTTPNENENPEDADLISSHTVDDLLDMLESSSLEDGEISSFSPNTRMHIFRQMQVWSRNRTYANILGEALFNVVSQYDLENINENTHNYTEDTGEELPALIVETGFFGIGPLSAVVNIPLDEPTERLPEPTEDEIRARAREYRQNERPDTPTLPESETSNDGEEDTNIDDDLKCHLCDREIVVQFAECTHATCKGCLKNLWWSRVASSSHYPSWVKCPWCRAEITKVRMLKGTPEELAEWESLVDWMKKHSARLRQRSNRSRF